MGQKTEARESLIFAIELGRSHGFFRTWLDTGEKICGTLVRLCPLISDDDQKRIYLNEVLTLCNGVFETVDTESGLSAILTEREIDILRLICQGHSNAEIAEHLFVTVNTVKKHTSNIYGKLDVTSRTQAIAKAREIELV
ncbi:MAG: response regulator transcription factor [Anaerolineaceae bacterium]|nr:response regulator transcription factor [Anaerolineaceae bacterium]